MTPTSTRSRWFRSAALALAVVGVTATAFADDFVNPKANIAAKAAPQRRNAGEGMPPLPLPATPLRRSEKKREPAPPALVGNVTFPKGMLGGKASFGTTIIDIEKWVEFTNAELGQRYRYVGTDFAKFSYDPTELPILFFTGWQAMPDLDEATIAKLRQYLMDGGTLVVNSSCGRPEFVDSFKRQVARLFPDREMLPIGNHHPIFSSYYPIDQMRVRKGSNPWQTLPTDAGVLYTVNIGTRAAVIFSPIDLSCGWDANANPIEGGVLYDQSDALKLGSNIVTYCLAEYQYGRFFDHQKVYHQATDATRDQLVVGQLVHNGDWDPTPHGVPNLLKTIDTSTTLHVQFKREPVDPEKGDIYRYPVLLMVGQQKFEFSDAARKRLRQYLDNGGTLIVDAAVGAQPFRDAFEAEVKKLYPDRPMTDVPADHPMFKFVFDETHPQLSPLGKQRHPGLTAPQFRGIQVDGQWPILYSPISLTAGWEQLPRAYNDGYADQDALRLGVDLFMYVVAH